MAVAIARRDAAASPPVEPPRRLRPFLSMHRLSSTALDAVRRVVDESPALRSAMAAAAPTEEDVGSRAAWLFVHRPAGWEDELGVLSAAAADRSSQSASAAEERTARRRLRAVEDELREARAAAARVTDLEAAFAEEQRARRKAEGSVAALQARLAGIERERDAAHRRASIAEQALVDGRRAGISADAPVRGRPEPRTAPVSAPAAGSASASMRLPSPLPPGVFDDDPAAADHLVRLPSAVLLVDGYNLSLRRWPERSLAEQRARLIDALNALVARVGVEVEVVFDGEEDSGRGLQSAGGRRRAVRVTFSPDDVDADEVLLARVDALPISRPVVVATDDRRVQREAGARGANVVGSTALFAALGLR